MDKTVLKREVACKDYEINVLKSEFKKFKQEKEGIEFKIKKFDNASKSLNMLLESQITDKSKKGLGYNVVPPYHPLIYNRPNKLDLSYSGLDEFKEPEFQSYASKDGKKESNIVCDKTSYASKENSDDSLAHCKYHQRERVVYGNNYNRVYYNYTTNRTHPNAQRNMVPRAVLMKIGLKPFNTTSTVNTAHPKSIVFSAKPMSCFSKSAQSTVKRSYQSKSVLTNKRFTQTNNTVKAKGVNTARPKAANTARPQSAVVNAVRVNQANAVKASACWGKPLMDDKGFVDRRNMTGNIAYLSNFKEFDGVYVTFGGEAHGGRIFGKGTLKTDNLDFEDVYFVNELKFNLFSVSQMCDKKNYVLFTDTECLVLSPNFKLPNESQILLKIPRKDNMYSFDMKNIVPKESLTYLVAKATLDESMLWHRRLGHINFKNINKIVKDNLVREKGIRREYSVARTPQQNGVAKMRNRTLIEAARTMLADSKLPTTFWAKAVSTACYVQNRVLVVKPHNKTPYELFRGFKPALSFMRQFGCHVTILNTLDHLGKFDGKSDECFFKNKPMIEGNGPKWLFDIDSLTQSMNYVPVAAGTNSNESAGTQGNLNVGTFTATSQDCIVMPIWKDASYFDSPSKKVGNDDPKSVVDNPKKDEEGPNNENNDKDKSKDDSSPKEDNTANQQVNTASLELNTSSLELITVDSLVNIEEPKRISKALSDPSWVEAMLEELLHKAKFNDERSLLPVARIEAIRLFLAYASFMGFMVYQMDVKSAFLYGQIEEEVYVCQPLGFEDPDHPDKVYKVVKALYGLHQAPRACSTKEELWLQVQQRKDGIFISQDKYVDDILRKFNYTDVKSASTPVDLEKPLVKDGDGTDVDEHLYRSMIGSLMYLTASRLNIMFAIKEVYVDDIIFGSTNKELCTAFEKLIKDKFQMSSMGELTFFLGLQVQQKEDGIFISQDKYVDEIFKKFNYTNVKSASTPIDLEKPLVKDEDANDVNVHLYRSMIGSLMYLTTSRPDIMFAVCACARFQVTPKISHLLAVKRIFRYLKGKPTLGLWYSRDSPFDLDAYTDSDYAGETQDRKSTTGGCQFLGNRLISWQCKKQTVVATSTTKAEYVAAASCCGQVLWIQNQLLDYGYSFMHTIINIDNNNTICIIENPVQHSKTKHIEIRHHFILQC
ncbi:putative ribonuclease H-like domain-containing protein [Tanacetum coccineum]